MSTISRQEAREVIREVRVGNGGISHDERAATPASVLQALTSVRRKLGAATKSFVTNLHSKDTQFVFELIQNAEDNSYTHVEADEEEIYLSFSLFPDRIVIDSNEDGFSKDHVAAICSVGESTKTLAQGYIGEKGIGFKSVFKVAKKVHIQSGSFSFAFEYTQHSDGDGLGMVTPLDEDFEDLPDDVTTRITLTLLDPSDFETRLQDLRDIPDTLLLFLNKLDRLRVNIHEPDHEATEIEYSKSMREGGNIETITKTTRINEEYEEDAQDFYVVRRQIMDLPVDPMRSHTNEATVVLAFPIDGDQEPIIETQHVYAFLPLRPVGFSFLIQSDFITQASREDVFHSGRNKALLAGVALTFRDAVVKFCNHPTLQYQWMRYLPSDSICDEFWGKLRDQIIPLLKQTPCLRPWSETSLYTLERLYRLSSRHKDQHGEPLFADLPVEVYLSRKYILADFKKLEPLGTDAISKSRLLDIVQSDLQKPDSRIRSNTTDQDWHTRTATLISTVLSNSRSTTIKRRVRGLPIIPLQNGIWVSANESSIYFPRSSTDVLIPEDLGLKLVDLKAVVNTARRSLFVDLGVTYSRSGDIRSLISKKYDDPPDVISLRQSISHLRYLYWHLRSDSTLDTKIFVFDQDTTKVHRTPGDVEYIYFEDDHGEYAPKSLFSSNSENDPDAPGFDVHFLNSEYLHAVSPEASNNGKSWKQWLVEYVGVKKHPQLRWPESEQLSDEFDYVIEHRPSKLVGLLKQFWSVYEPELTTTIVNNLKESFVPSGDSTSMLKETFLPLPNLKEKIEEYEIQDFPFLSISESLTENYGGQWEFLNRFGVKSVDSVEFYLKALDKVCAKLGDDWDADALVPVFNIYSAIEQNCSSQEDRLSVRCHFQENEVIPLPLDHDSHWVSVKECVWKGPKWLTIKYPLANISHFANYEHLFHVILKAGDAGWKDYRKELQGRKSNLTQNFETILDIYHHLWREFEHGSAWEDIRTSFESQDLIFVPSQNSWQSISSCLWAEDNVRIPRMASIKSPYTHLEDFFCRILGVCKPNLNMHVQALKDMALIRPPSEADLKDRIMLISSMDPTSDDLEALKRSNIFSVKPANGTKTFTDTTSEFAIIDRAEYGAAFAGMINLLDYSIKEVRACRSFLLALGLKGRHLSELVEESTTVQDGSIKERLTRQFRSKAYALFRCAVHYRSPKSRDDDHSLYHKLLRTSIYVTDGIFKSMTVTQYGNQTTVDSTRANFHLEDGNELKLYIPRDKDFREQCLFRQLPKGLMKHFQVFDPTAEALLSSIIGCNSLRAVDGILADAGIVDVDDIKRSAVIEQEVDELDDTRLSIEDDVSDSTESSELPSRLLTPTVTSEAASQAHEASINSADFLFSEHVRRYESGSIRGESFATSPTPPSSMGPNDVENPSTGYAALLEQVIQSAERMTIPDRGSSSVDDHQISLSVNSLDTMFAARSIERDRKVGAAGELFIFELLLGLELHRFSEANWKSTIRKEVRVHPKYQDLSPWQGRETSDIVYHDMSGTFTSLLIDKNYLDGDVWAGEKPTYYLEVKTTTRDCTEQFYMSGAQYLRAERMMLHPRRARPEVYVILRVFNLEGRIGFRIYVDPESCRADGELRFSVDTWGVRPVCR